MTAEELCKKAAEEIASYGQRVVVTAELSAPSTIRLIALLQLASRHPGISGEDHKFITLMVDRLGQGFDRRHEAIRELIRRGWAQQHDQELSA